MSELDLSRNGDDDENESEEELAEDLEVEFCYGPRRVGNKSKPFILIPIDDTRKEFSINDVKSIPRADIGIINFYPGISNNEELSCRSGDESVTIDYDREGELIGLTVQDFSSWKLSLGTLKIQLETKKGDRKRLTKEAGKQLALDGGSRVKSLNGTRSQITKHRGVEDRGN